jgi:hypothetical protein
VKGLITPFLLLGVTGLGTLLFKVHPVFGRKLALYIIFVIIESSLLFVAYTAGETKIVNLHSGKASELNQYFENNFETDNINSGNCLVREKQISREVIDSIQAIFSVSAIQKDIRDCQKDSLLAASAAICILGGLIGLSKKLEGLTNRNQD